MTKKQIKEIIETCSKERKLCRIFLRYDLNYSYLFPLILNDKLFLGIEEDDFILDGYFVRRFNDVIKAQFRNDMCEKILKDEGIVDSIVVPDIDIANWEAVFKSLERAHKNVIVENESLDENESEFVIGRIEKVFRNFVYIRHFDAGGVWQDEPYKFSYTDITSVSFGTRYCDTFSKHLGELPVNFGK